MMSDSRFFGEVSWNINGLSRFCLVESRVKTHKTYRRPLRCLRLSFRISSGLRFLPA